MTRMGVWRIQGLGVLLMGGVFASLSWAEQVEMVTYYPQPPASTVPDPLYVNSAAVGAVYNGQPTPPNGLLVQGRLGVGTTDPRLPIHVRGDSDGGGILLQYAGLRWSFPASSPRRNEGEFSLYRGGTDADGILTLRRYTRDHTILKIWAPPAFLGPNPNPTYEATLSLVRGEEPNVEYIDLYNNGYPTERQFGIRIQKRGTGQFRDFVFDQYDGTTKTPLMVLAASRNVGVGTVSPAAKLHVVGDSTTTWYSHLLLTNTANEASGLCIDAANRDWAIAGTNPSSAMGDQKFVIYDATAFSARLTIDSGGRVGVGKIDPAYLLDVNGDTKVSGRVIIGSSSVDVEAKLRELEDRIRALGG